MQSGYIKVSFSFLLIVLLSSDITRFSKTVIEQRFWQNTKELKSAARFGNANASFALFQQSQDNHWLQLAAQQGHVEAAFLWYQQAPSSRLVWLKQAKDLAFAPAQLAYLNLLIEQQRWPQAHTLAAQFANNSNNFTQTQQVKLQQLTSIIDSALTDTLVTPVPKPFQLASTQQAKVDLTCRLRVQVLYSHSEFAQHTAKYQQALTNSAMSALPICVNPPVQLPELRSICQPDKLARIECQLDKLAVKLSQKPELQDLDYSHLVLLVDKGEANTRGGLMYLDKNDTGRVFIHELGHWLGFVDEYQIGQAQQAQLCQTDGASHLGKNLFVSKADISQAQAQSLAGRALFAVDTCNGSGFRAYKFQAEPSFMQYLNLDISPLYRQILLDDIDWSDIVPAAMNFAHIFRDDYDTHVSYLKQAASLGYQGAITEFSESLIASGQYSKAKDWLEFGAEYGGVNSLLLLGHAYLEGRWLPRDLVQSATWYKKAAELNDGYGLYFYGKCLEMGWGCPQSIELAFEYYQQAAKLGNPLALRKVAALPSNS